MKRFIALFLIVFVIGAVVLMAQKKPQDTYTLKAMNGNVTLNHKTHSALPGVKCETCHHASKAKMPNKDPQQACSECHTKPAKPGVPSMQAAYHNPAATAGVCIDCHKKSAAEGKKAPVKCADCHKRA